MNAASSSNSASLNLQHAAVQSGRDTHINVMNPSLHAKEILEQRVAFGALFNSDERFDPPKCHPDTRTAVLETIDSWARNTSGDSKPILWLRGGAGAGKSAVAQTSAEQWAELGILVASFFFSRNAPGRNDSSCFTATLAYQISLSIPSTWPHVERALLNDVGLFRKRLQTRMHELIVHPLQAAAADVGRSRIVILIDGLDECCSAVGTRDHEAQQQEILETISRVARSHNGFLCFLIASRPERQIRASFEEREMADLTHIIDLSMTEGSAEDIWLFVECSFDRIRARNRHLESSWPPAGTIDLMVEKSSNHFIYASTAMQHIGRPRYDPEASLQAVLNATSATNSEESPFATLDALYMLILNAVTKSSLPSVLQIFQVLLFDRFGSPLQYRIFQDITINSPTFMERYLCIPPGSSYRHLVDLHSILRIPELDQAATTAIRFVHASFGEFLTNPSRSQSFFLDKLKALEALQIGKLQHLVIQSISPECGRGLDYVDCRGILYSFGDLLGDQQPSEAVASGILALIGNNCQFSRYLDQTGWTHLGTARDPSSVKGILANQGYRNERDIHEYLSKCGIQINGDPFSAAHLTKMLATECNSEDCHRQHGNPTSTPEHIAEPNSSSSTKSSPKSSNISQVFKVQGSKKSEIEGVKKFRAFTSHISGLFHRS